MSVQRNKRADLLDDTIEIRLEIRDHGVIGAFKNHCWQIRQIVPGEQLRSLETEGKLNVVSTVIKYHIDTLKHKVIDAITDDIRRVANKALGAKHGR